MKKLKVITYNVLDGFENAPERKSGVAQFLKDQQPDIVFFNELNDFKEEDLKELAKQYNHSNVILLSGRSDYKIAITANSPFSNTEFHYQNLLGHGFIYTNTHNITLLNTHLHPHSIQKRKNDVELIIKRLNPDINSKLVLFGGDLNAYFHGEQNQYKDEINHLRKWYVYRTSKDSKFENLINNELDFSVTKQIADSNLIDLLSQQNKHFQKSYPTLLDKDFRYEDPMVEALNIDRKKINGRIDYLWASPSLAKHCTSCNIIINSKTDYLSDHYPLIAEFSI